MFFEAKKHLQEASLSYYQHCCFSLKLVFYFLKAGIMGLIHAIYPGAFKSSMIASLPQIEAAIEKKNIEKFLRVGGSRQKIYFIKPKNSSTCTVRRELFLHGPSFYLIFSGCKLSLHGNKVCIKVFSLRTYEKLWLPIEQIYIYKPVL